MFVSKTEAYFANKLPFFEFRRMQSTVNTYPKKFNSYKEADIVENHF